MWHCLSQAPDLPSVAASLTYPSCVPRQTKRPGSESQPILPCMRTAMHTAASAVLLQGSSLWCGVVVSAPSSLNRPHGPHSTTQDNFDAQRLYALSCYCGSLL